MPEICPMDQVKVFEPDQALRAREYLLLSFFSFILFGYSMIGGRPLTMHEAVLPQSACEMLADGDWIVPKGGGRPWLERPPLPQWITVGTATVSGTCAQEWVVRLPSVIIAAGVVLLVALIASLWFHRTTGLLSGLLMATMFEFTRYAWLAEADIYLCGIVTAAIAVFVQLEFAPTASLMTPQRFWGKRPLLLLLFFVLLGLTNLAKGLLFGSIMVLSPILGFFLWNRSRRQMSRYAWLWGWLIFLIIAGAWPLAAWLRYPDVIDVWWFDLGGRLSGNYTAINQPLWYYPITLSWATQPWTVPAAFGLLQIWRRAFDVSNSPERFLCCWAVLPIAVFSIASGKHHHYLLQCLAPWAMLASLGLIWLGNRILAMPAWKHATVTGWLLLGVLGAAAVWRFSPQLSGLRWLPWALIAGWITVAVTLASAVSRGNARWAMSILLGTIVSLYALGYTYAGRVGDQGLADTAFLRDVPANIPPGIPLVVNADLQSMDVFRILFYLHDLGDQVVPIHNLTYLAEERIQNKTVYLISRWKDLSSLARYGTAEVILQSARTRRETSPEDRFTLFRLTFHKDLLRFPAPPRTSPMQAMGRETGPYVGKAVGNGHLGSGEAP
jgi:4-amino-4-deoxy-L-arabinose transferase-like glycosyltransferase